MLKIKKKSKTFCNYLLSNHILSLVLLYKSIYHNNAWKYRHPYNHKHLDNRPGNGVVVNSYLVKKKYIMKFAFNKNSIKKLIIILFFSNFLVSCKSAKKYFNISTTKLLENRYPLKTTLSSLREIL